MMIQQITLQIIIRCVFTALVNCLTYYKAVFRPVTSTVLKRKFAAFLRAQYIRNKTKKEGL